MSEEALNYCRDRALYSGSPLALTQLFTPPPLRAPVLAAQGLLADLLDIPETVSEPSVGYAKLDWWRAELSAGPEAAARHPALRAVAAVRPDWHLAPGLLTELLDGLRQVLERPVYNTEQELWQDCQRLGGASLDVQMTILGSTAPPALRDAYALHYFLRALHRFNRLTGCAPWPFPMNLQARHQVSRQSLTTQWFAAAAMIKDLLHYVSARLPPASPLRRATQTPQAMPALLLNHLERRLLRRYLYKPQCLLRVGGQRWQPGDALSLWWQSQRLRRLQRQL